MNPDFGQVEADPSVVNLTTYETFFEEQRPFFLEGKTLFEFEVDDDLLFYSRRIGRPPSYDPSTDGFKRRPEGTRILGATKLTGKTSGGLSVGALYALTAEEKAHVSEDGEVHRPVVEPLTHFSVARLRQDLNDGATAIGGMFTSTLRDISEPHLDFLPEKAFSGGVDISHRWLERTHFVDFQLIGSQLSGSPEAMGHPPGECGALFSTNRRGPPRGESFGHEPGRVGWVPRSR